MAGKSRKASESSKDFKSPELDRHRSAAIKTLLIAKKLLSEGAPPAISGLPKVGSKRRAGRPSAAQMKAAIGDAQFDIEINDEMGRLGYGNLLNNKTVLANSAARWAGRNATPRTLESVKKGVIRARKKSARVASKE